MNADLDVFQKQMQIEFERRLMLVKNKCQHCEVFSVVAERLYIEFERLYNAAGDIQSVGIQADKTGTAKLPIVVLSFIFKKLLNAFKKDLKIITKEYKRNLQIKYAVAKEIKEQELKVVKQPLESLSELQNEKEKYLALDRSNENE